RVHLLVVGFSDLRERGLDVRAGDHAQRQLARRAVVLAVEDDESRDAEQHGQRHGPGQRYEHPPSSGPRPAARGPGGWILSPVAAVEFVCAVSPHGCPLGVLIARLDLPETWCGDLS